MSERELIKLETGETLTGVLKYADKMKGKGGKGDYGKLVLTLDDGEEVTTFVPLTVLELLAGAGTITPMSGSRGPYLKVSGSPTVSLTKEMKGRIAHYVVAVDDEELTERGELGGGEPVTPSPRGRAPKVAVGDAETVARHWESISANHKVALAMAAKEIELVRKAGFELPDASLLSIASTLFISADRRGLDSGAYLQTIKQSEDRAPEPPVPAVTPESLRAKKRGVSRFDKVPAALKEGDDDELPF